MSNAGAFHELMNASKLLHRKDGNILVICFDFEKNLPLPLTNLGQEYYKRQLWLHNFCVHDVGSGEATMFLYAEHYANKGPNEVISCLQFYLESFVRTEAEIIHIFCDNCGGQNKNRYIFLFFQMLASAGKFKQIFVHFPVPGHSYMPCDQDFALIEKQRRHKQQVLVPSGWVNMIKEARNENFEIVYVQHPLMDDMRPDGTPVCKVFDYKSAFEKHLNTVIDGGMRQIKGLKFEGDKVFVRHSLLNEEYFEVNLVKVRDVNFDAILSGL